MKRPRYTRKDATQAQIVAKLREAGCTVISLADLPGDPLSNPLDLLVISPDFKRAVQVEVKNSIGEDFTPNERLYLKRAGVWDYPGPFSPPEGHCVMAAWRADDILRHLGLVGKKHTPMPKPTSSTVIRIPG